MKHQKLIEDLVADLEPVRPIKQIGTFSQVWLIVASVIAIFIAWLLGQYRENALVQLIELPTFMLETFFGALTLSLLAYRAMSSTIPSERPMPFVFGILPYALLLTWLSLYLYEAAKPPMNFSSVGERPHCYLETMLMAFLPLVLGVLWARKGWSVNSAKTGMLFGITAGLVAAMVMQFACMYEPKHALLFHFFPGFVMGFIGLILARYLIKN